MMNFSNMIETVNGYANTIHFVRDQITFGIYLWETYGYLPLVALCITSWLLSYPVGRFFGAVNEYIWSQFYDTVAAFTRRCRRIWFVIKRRFHIIDPPEEFVQEAVTLRNLELDLHERRPILRGSRKGEVFNIPATLLPYLAANTTGEPRGNFVSSAIVSTDDVRHGNDGGRNGNVSSNGEIGGNGLGLTKSGVDGPTISQSFRNSPDIRNEAAQPGSSLRPIYEGVPKFLCAFANSDGVIGMGFRNGNHVYTAMHVWRLLPVTFKLVGVNDKCYGFEKKEIVCQHIDHDRVRLSGFERHFTALGLGSCKMRIPRVHTLTSIYSYDGAWLKSEGQVRVEKSFVVPMIHMHDCATDSGTSGSPTIQEGNVVGIHIGFHERLRKNVMISLADYNPEFMKDLPKTDLLEVVCEAWLNVSSSSKRDDEEADDRERYAKYLRDLDQVSYELRTGGTDNLDYDAKFASKKEELRARTLAKGQLTERGTMQWADMDDNEDDEFSQREFARHNVRYEADEEKDFPRAPEGTGATSKQPSIITSLSTPVNPGGATIVKSQPVSIKSEDAKPLDVQQPKKKRVRSRKQKVQESSQNSKSTIALPLESTQSETPSSSRQQELEKQLEIVNQRLNDIMQQINSLPKLG